MLQSAQLLQAKRSSREKRFLAVISISGTRAIRIQQEDEKVEVSGDYAIVRDKASVTEYWSKLYKEKAVYLVSYKDGSRKFIGSDTLYTSYTFSPAGKYLIYYDAGKRNYYSYNMISGTTLNISQHVPTMLGLNFQDDSLPGIRRGPVGIAGWSPNDKALFVYDNYDIWKLDPVNRELPINITNGYGKRNNIKLRLLNENINTVYTARDTLLLTAFDDLNKDNGFYFTAFKQKK